MSSSTPSTVMKPVPPPLIRAPIRLQHVDHVEDLGLQRRVLDHGGAPAEGGGHDEVLGAGVRGGVEVEGGAREAGGLDVDDGLALVHDRAQALVAQVVEVQVAAAQVAAADALDDRLTEPVQQGGHEQHGSAETAGRSRRAAPGWSAWEASITSVRSASWSSTLAPMASASSTARRTSSMIGTLRRTVRPLAASSAAPIMGRTAFFAPWMKAVPRSGLPPRTR